MDAVSIRLSMMPLPSTPLSAPAKVNKPRCLMNEAVVSTLDPIQWINEIGFSYMKL